MKRAASGDDGFVTVIALLMMVITLMLAFAMLAVVDVQGSGARASQSDSTAYALAESIAQDTVAVIGSGQFWPQSALDTRTGSDAQNCGANGYDSTTTSTGLGAALADMVTQTLASPGTWKVNICAVATPGETWSDSFLNGRNAHATYSDPAVRDLVWIRAQTTQRNVRRAVVLQARVKRTPTYLPNGDAVITGGFTNDLSTTAGTLTNSGVLGGVTSTVLGSSGGEYKNSTGGSAPIAVRCGLLSVLQSGQVCFSGTVAGLTTTTGNLGVGNLNTLLGLNKFEQAASEKVVSEDPIKQYKAEADSTSTHTTTLNNGDSCFKGLPTDTTGDVVFIDKVGNGTTDRCVVQQLSSSVPRRAKILIVQQGGVTIDGPYAASASLPAAPAVPSTTFQGVLYVLNQNNDGTANTDLPGRTVVVIRNGGKVDGAVMVDGSGLTETDPPALALTNALCSSLGLLGGLTCNLLSAVGLAGVLNGLTDLSVISNVVATLSTQLSNYTAVSRNPTVIDAAFSQVPSGAAQHLGTFRQIAPN